MAQNSVEIIDPASDKRSGISDIIGSFHSNISIIQKIRCNIITILHLILSTRLELYDFIRQRILNNILGEEVYGGRNFIYLFPFQEKEKKSQIID